MSTSGTAKLQNPACCIWPRRLASTSYLTMMHLLPKHRLARTSSLQLRLQQEHLTPPGRPRSDQEGRMFANTKWVKMGYILTIAEALSCASCFSLANVWRKTSAVRAQGTPPDDTSVQSACRITLAPANAPRMDHHDLRGKTMERARARAKARSD